MSYAIPPIIEKDITFNTTKKLYFRDSAIYIYSADDGHLDLVADTSIDLNSAVITTSTVSLGGNIFPTSADGASLGTATNEFSDLFLADGGIIKLGNDQDVTLTHVADTGILLNSTRRIQFGDAGTNIAQLDDGHLDVTADVSIDLNGLVVGTGRITTDDTTEATTTLNGSLQTDGGASIAKSIVFGGALTGHITTVNDATYNLATTDFIVHITRTTTGTCTITLPSAQVVAGRTFYVKDAGGNASVYNITIDTQGSELIDGEADVVIDGDYESKNLYSNGTNWFITTTYRHYCDGSMYTYENAVPTTIRETSVYQAIEIFESGSIMHGTTFTEGSNGEITDTADNGSGLLRCTDVAHGLTTGQYITLTGMGDAAHSGETAVTVIDEDTFDCDDISWNSDDDTGYWQRGAFITIDTGHGGTFVVSYSASLSAAAANKDIKIEIAKNLDNLDEFATECRLTTANVMQNLSSSAPVKLVGGDVVWLKIKNLTDTSDITIKNGNIHLTKTI